MAVKKVVKKKVEKKEDKLKYEEESKTVVIKEQFVPPKSVVTYERMGYVVTEINDTSGSTQPESVRVSYLNAVRAKTVVYMTKKA